MAIKSIILITILVALVVIQVQAQFGLDKLITGIVPCSLNGTVNLVGSTITNPFPNATVQLSCGGNVIASTTTSQSGGFNISVRPSQVSLNNLVSSCGLGVPTPLSTCNATLPSAGSLKSGVEIVILGNATISAEANITLLAPTEFVYTQT